MPLVWRELNAHRGRLRGRTLQWGKAWVVQWSRLARDTSAKVLEAGPAGAPGSFVRPSLALCPTAPVYRDDTLAPTTRPWSLLGPVIASRHLHGRVRSMLRVEHEQVLVGRWWSEESIQIDDDLGRQCCGASSMKDGQPCIIVHDQGVLRANLARGCLRNLGSDPGTAPLPTSFSYTQDAKAHWKIDMGFLMI